MIASLFQKLAQKIGNDRASFCQHVTGYIIFMFVFVFLSQNNIDAYACTLSRGIVLFFFNLPYALSQDYTTLTPKSSRYLIFRQFLLIVYSSIYAQMFFYLPVNLVYTINACGPLFVLIFDYLIYHIKISKVQLFGVFLAILGVLLNINGNLIYYYLAPGIQFDTKFQNYKPEAVNPFFQLIVGIFFLAAQAAWGYAIILIKKIDNATYYHHNFVYGTVMTLFGGCIYSYTVVPQQNRLNIFVWSLILQGIPLAIAQLLFVHALFLSKKLGITTMAAFLTIALSYVLKIFRYEQTVNLVCVFGTVLIVIGIYKIVITQ